MLLFCQTLWSLSSGSAALFPDSLVPCERSAALFSDSLVPCVRSAALVSDSLVPFDRFAALFERPAARFPDSLILSPLYSQIL